MELRARRVFNLSFAGVPFVLLGLAVALSDFYPRWLGWIAALAGVGSVAAGLVQAFTGEPMVASLVLTIIGPTIISPGVTPDVHRFCGTPAS